MNPAAPPPAAVIGVETSSPGASEPALPSPAAAEYRVPVPAELEPYATFELGDLRFRERGAEWALEYSLPVLLVGQSARLSFRGVADANGAYLLSGDAGQVTCHVEGDRVHCEEVLVTVQQDAQKLERALAAFSSEEGAARRAVAARFSDDPIGVLTFPR
jgi:hypothetical protein